MATYHKPPSPRPKTWLILAVLSCVVFALGVWIGKQTSTTQTKTDIPKSQVHQDSSSSKTAVLTVESVSPVAIDVKNSLSTNGVIAAKQTAQVGARLSGVAIESVAVQVGDFVKKGQVLAVLDDLAIHEQVAQAQADLEQAMVNHEQAMTDLQRIEPLLEMDAVSRQQVDIQRTAVKQAQTAINHAKARLNTAKNQMTNTKVIAPVSGIISDKQAHVGMVVSGSPLFTIITDGKLEWQATLTSVQANLVNVGTKAVLTVANNPITAVVEKLSPTANDKREVIAHVSLPVGSGVKAGVYQTGELILGEKAGFGIPKSSLVIEDGQAHIWQLMPTDDGLHKVAKVLIDVQGYQGELAIADVSSDVLMVKQGASFLNDGDVVKVVEIGTSDKPKATQGE